MILFLVFNKMQEMYYSFMAGIAQLVRALDCDSRCRRFDPGCPPHFFLIFLLISSCANSIKKPIYPDDQFIEILRRQGEYGDKFEISKNESKKESLEFFRKIHHILSQEYEIEKYSPNKLIVTKPKNMQKINAMLIGDTIHLSCFQLNEQKRIASQCELPDKIKQRVYGR